MYLTSFLAQINFIPNPVLIDLGFTRIYWYGLIITFAILSGLFLAINEAKRQRINVDIIYDLTIFGVIFGILSARIVHVLLFWEYYSQHLIEILKIWEGGLAIHGAIISTVLVAYIYCRRYKLKLFT